LLKLSANTCRKVALFESGPPANTLAELPSEVLLFLHSQDQRGADYGSRKPRAGDGRNQG
jgi:hypothetical protein